MREVAEGWAALGRGDHAAAQRLLAAALTLEPGHADALHGLGVVHALAAETPAALDLMARAHAAAPGHEAIRRNATALVQQIGSRINGDPAALTVLLGGARRAVRYLHLRAALGGSSLAVSHHLGLLLLELGEPEHAEAHFLAALRRCRDETPRGLGRHQVNLAGILGPHGRNDFIIRHCVFDLREDLILTAGTSITARPSGPVPATPAGGPRLAECFMYYNEADVLAIKLSEHAPHVDRFIVVEGTRSFSGEPRALAFPAVLERLGTVAEKVTFIPADLPVCDHPYAAEILLRDQLARGLSGLTPEDFVLVTDPDEVIRGEVLARLRLDLVDPALEIAAFRVRTFWHGLNYLCVEAPEQRAVDGIPQPIYPVGARMRVMAANTPTDLRQKRPLLGLLDDPRAPLGTPAVRIYHDAGWHFSFLGTKAALIEKMRNYGHPELYDPDALDALDLADTVARGGNFLDGSGGVAFKGWRFRRVPIDGSFPALLRREPDRFAAFTV